MIDNNPNVIHERGSVGELPIHLCFIFNSPLGGPQDQMAWYMIDKDPSIIRGVYDSDKCTLYTGENVLHIAIVNQRFDLVKKLITENPRLLEASATGDFFQVGKPCYFGEFPLAFAATTNQIEIFDYLLEAGANMDREDSNRNNLLHMLVIHSLPDLYTHVYKKWVSVFGEDGRGVKVPLWQRPNKNGFTPFKLCAELGLKDMFNYLIEDRKIIQWSYGPVTCMIYPLDELDFEPEDETPPTLIPTATDAATSSTTNTISPKTSPRVNLSRKSSEKNLGGTWRSVLTQAQEKKPSALELIINNYHFDLLENSRIENLIEKKWEGFAKDIVMTRFIAVIFNLIILTAFTIVRESILDQQTAYTTRISTCAVADTYDINTCAPHLLSTDGITAFETNIFYVLLSILLFFAAYKGYKEFTEMCNDFLGYFSQQGSALLENLVSSTYCLSIFIFTTFYTFDIPLQQLFLAIASMAGYLYLFFFLLTFETTGPMVVMVYRMLEQDVFRFVLIFLVFLLGFSQAFFVLDDNTTFIGSLSSCFEALLGDFEVKV